MCLLGCVCVRLSVRLYVRVGLCNRLQTEYLQSYERILINFWRGGAWPNDQSMRFCAAPDQGPDTEMLLSRAAIVDISSLHT